MFFSLLFFFFQPFTRYKYMERRNTDANIFTGWDSNFLLVLVFCMPQVLKVLLVIVIP